MSVIRNMLLGSLLSLATLQSVPAAATMPVLDQLAVQDDVVDARVVCGPSGCYDTNRPPPGWRPPPPPPGWRPPVYRPPVYVPPPVYRPPVYIPPPPPVYRVPPGTWSAHVNWCLNRYRSYNPQTNRYLGYDGYYKICYSPYM